MNDDKEGSDYYFFESEWHWNPIVDEEGEIVNRPDWESRNRD